MELPSKYCHNCGKSVLLGAKFCSSCGTSLASIDEMPPAAPVPSRVAPKIQATFKPRVIGEEEDDDETVLRADKVQSISELGLSMSSLDCDVRVDRPQSETVGGLVQQAKMSQGGFSPDAPRPAPALSNQDVLAQIQRESSTLRK